MPFGHINSQEVLISLEQVKFDKHFFLQFQWNVLLGHDQVNATIRVFFSNIYSQDLLQDGTVCDTLILRISLQQFQKNMLLQKDK